MVHPSLQLEELERKGKAGKGTARSVSSCSGKEDCVCPGSFLAKARALCSQRVGSRVNHLRAVEDFYAEHLPGREGPVSGTHIQGLKQCK